MVDQATVQAIVIGGAILGGIGRQLLPYLRKLAASENSGTTVTYKHRYTFTTIFSVVVAAVVGMTLFPQLVANLPANAPLTSIFITAFLTAWGSASLFANVAATGNGDGVTPTPTGAAREKGVQSPGSPLGSKDV